MRDAVCGTSITQKIQTNKPKSQILRNLFDIFKAVEIQSCLTVVIGGFIRVVIHHHQKGKT